MSTQKEKSSHKKVEKKIDNVVVIDRPSQEQTMSKQHKSSKHHDEKHSSHKEKVVETKKEKVEEQKQTVIVVPNDKPKKVSKYAGVDKETKKIKKLHMQNLISMLKKLNVG